VDSDVDEELAAAKAASLALFTNATPSSSAVSITPSSSSNTAAAAGNVSSGPNVGSKRKHVPTDNIGTSVAGTGSTTTGASPLSSLSELSPDSSPHSSTLHEDPQIE
jgi:hypothetical protein